MAILLSGTVGATAIPSIKFVDAPVPITLAGATSYIIPPGPHAINPGQYTELQQFDGVAGIWRKARYPGTDPYVVDSDGCNYRLFNTTGCAVGALITNGGTSYTSAPAITASFGGSLWSAIVGGSINTTVTVTTAGVYNYIPTLKFSDPPAGGIRPSAIAVLGAGGISSVTVVNAGAGYAVAPTITIVPDPRETGTQGGVLTVNATLANVGVVTAVICTDPGTSTSTSVPTLTFTGGTTSTAASATALMNFTVTGFTVVSQGSSFGTSVPFLVESFGPVIPAAAATSVDPQLDAQLNFQRTARLMGFTNSSGNVIASATSLTTLDAGWGFYSTPSLVVISPFIPTVAASLTAIVGATTDTSTTQKLKV